MNGKVTYLKRKLDIQGRSKNGTYDAIESGPERSPSPANQFPFGLCSYKLPLNPAWRDTSTKKALSGLAEINALMTRRHQWS